MGEGGVDCPGPNHSSHVLRQHVQPEEDTLSIETLHGLDSPVHDDPLEAGEAVVEAVERETGELGRQLTGQPRELDTELAPLQLKHVTRYTESVLSTNPGHLEDLHDEVHWSGGEEVVDGLWVVNAIPHIRHSR